MNRERLIRNLQATANAIAILPPAENLPEITDTEYYFFPKGFIGIGDIFQSTTSEVFVATKLYYESNEDNAKGVLLESLDRTNNTIVYEGPEPTINKIGSVFPDEDEYDIKPVDKEPIKERPKFDFEQEFDPDNL